jgi:hypothetical protein
MEQVASNENFYKGEGLPIPDSGSDAIGRTLVDALRSKQGCW